ncbi:MAG: ABC transporter permease [Anaerolineales bacterium]|nr:ABC transporter permease [Anaerolineales bacterium]
MSDQSPSSRPAPETILLRPSRGWSALNLRDLWVYRELIYFLIWRDIKVRYKQTALGAAWAVLQPLITMIVFTFFFGNLLEVNSDGLPYPVFSYTALLPWGLFSKAIGDAGRSLVMNRNMLTKIYFPRLVIPIASVLSGLLDFAIAFVVLLGLMWYYRITPTAAIWLLPFLLLLTLVTALGVGLWLSALNVIYRDIGYVIPFLTQVWFYVTPIVYSSSELPASLRIFYAINPMVGVVDGFRWALLGTDTAPGASLLVSAIVALVLMVTGLYYFRRMERTFADMI